MTAMQIAGSVMLAVGMIAVIRSVIIVAGGGAGRFRLDPWLRPNLHWTGIHR